jgi:hypothetical protein
MVWDIFSQTLYKNYIMDKTQKIVLIGGITALGSAVAYLVIKNQKAKSDEYAYNAAQLPATPMTTLDRLRAAATNASTVLKQPPTNGRYAPGDVITIGSRQFKIAAQKNSRGDYDLFDEIGVVIQRGIEFWLQKGTLYFKSGSSGTTYKYDASKNTFSKTAVLRSLLSRIFTSAGRAGGIDGIEAMFI